MKILLFIDSLDSGGAQRQMVGLAKLLQDRKYQVKVIYYHPVCFYRAYLYEHHISNEYVAGSENKIKRMFLLARAIRQFQPNIVISYLDAPNMIACILKVLGMKFQLITSERNTSQSPTKKEKIKFFLLRFADAIVPNSHSQEQYIKKYYPRLYHKVYTIINFVDSETFNPALNKKRGFVIIVVASAWRPKNTLGLIEAAKVVKDHGHPFIIRWYGVDDDTPYVKECQKRIMEYGLEDVFQLLPKTASIAQELQKADYFCLPSFYEGTSNAMCEALACGLPILCSNVCDNVLYVTEDVNGFLFNPQIVSEIVGKIEKALLLSDEDYQSYCKVSRKIAKTFFSEERFILDYVSLLKNEEAFL